MGYRQKKQQIEQKIKRIKYILLSVLLLFVGGFCVFSAVYPPPTWKHYFHLPTVSDRKDGELRIHFLDVGQGDCTFIEFPDGQTLLIDGGDTQTNTENAIMRYLNALQIKRLDYILITHTDEDHCGGLDSVISYKKVSKIFLPQTKDVNVNVAYAKAYSAAMKSDAEKSVVGRGVSITSQDENYPYTFCVIYPYAAVANDVFITSDNAASAVSWLDYFGVSALFTGDMSVAIEEQLMQESKNNLLDIYGVQLSSTEILKVAHHGSRYSTSKEFAAYINAKTAMISCGKDNVYGHPHIGVLQTLKEVGAQVYRTDLMGSILAVLRPDGTYEVQSQIKNG